MKKLIILIAITISQTQGSVYYKIVANSFNDGATIKKLSPQWFDFIAVGTWTKADSISSSGTAGSFSMYSTDYKATLMVRTITHYDFIYSVSVKNENSAYPTSRRFHYTLYPTTYTGQVILRDGYLDRPAYLGTQTYTGIVTVPSPVITTPSPVVTTPSPINTIVGVETITSPIDTIVVEPKDSLVLKDSLTSILYKEDEIPYKIVYYDIQGNQTTNRNGILIEIRYYIGRIEKRKIVIVE